MVLDTRVTRRRLQLGARDPQTGWRTQIWTEHTIEALVISRGATNIQVLAGVHVTNDAVAVMLDPCVVDDELEQPSGIFYKVMSVLPHWLANSFIYRTCQLSRIPYHS